MTQTTQAWPQRFGTMTNVQIKSSRKGPYAIITVDCTKFTQVAFAFGPKLVEAVKAAGIGSKVWFKGPIEAVARTNENGGEYTEDQMKVVYFKNKSAIDDVSETVVPATEVAPETPDDLTVLKGVGSGIAAKLVEAGITTFTALAAMDDEALEAIGAGTAKRAQNGDWRGQAATLSAEKAAAATAVREAELEAEIPF